LTDDPVLDYDREGCGRAVGLEHLPAMSAFGGVTNFFALAGMVGKRASYARRSFSSSGLTAIKVGRVFRARSSLH
jgi:hypothetical protein